MVVKRYKEDRQGRDSGKPARLKFRIGQEVARIGQLARRHVERHVPRSRVNNEVVLTAVRHLQYNDLIECEDCCETSEAQGSGRR